MTPIRRICLFAGPGVGKSTAAMWLTSHFKKRAISAEYVSEAVKEWAFAGCKITPYDQLYIFAEQMQREELLLRNGVRYIVTVSPIRLGICYGVKYECPFCQQLSAIADKFDQQYTPLNILLKRATATYIQEGRYENYEQALEMDAAIYDSLCFDRNGYTQVDAHDLDGIFDLVRRKIGMD